MSSSELLEISSKGNPNLKEEIEERRNHKKSQDSKENPKDIPVIPERELNTDFSLTFKEIYNIHMTEIESKTSLKRKHIYIILGIAFFFFLVGHLQRTFSYLLTGFYPLKWTIQDFKLNNENFGKKWGTYWAIFLIFVFFDMHKNEVLKIIPLYFIIKTVFLIVLFLPGFTAAANLYDGLFKDILQYLSTYFLNKEDSDTLLNEVKKIVKVKNE
jgi:receptor expression-enhancing protein 5/6